MFVEGLVGFDLVDRVRVLASNTSFSVVVQLQLPSLLLYSVVLMTPLLPTQVVEDIIFVEGLSARLADFASSLSVRRDVEVGF